MPLAIYTSAAWTANGGIEPAAGATVEVRSEATGSLVSLFEDRDGEVGLDNPFTADAQGRFAFFVAGGAYRVKVTDGENEHTLRWQAVGTFAESDVSALGIDTAGPAAEDVLAAVGRGAIVESGSNSNGHYVRWENGEQVCWVRGFTLEYNTSTNIGNVWSFPAEFINDQTVVRHGVTSSAGVAVSASQIGWQLSLTPNTTSIELRCYRISGSPNDFESGDTLPTAVIAWGFWK